MTIRIQGNVVINNNRDATVRNVTSTGTISLTANTTSIRQTNTSTWSGNPPNGIGKLEYHSNRWYINAAGNSTEVVRFRRGGTDVANINNSGQLTMAAGTTTSHAVRGDRTLTINSGGGLSGGASQNLAGNRTWNLAVDGTVVRTSGNQTIGGRKTFSSGLIGSNTNRILIPGGARFSTTTNVVTGAIRIQLPTARFNSNTMMTMKVVIYNYSTQTSRILHVGGYNNTGSGGTWFNCFATQESDRAVGDLNVRFGRSGSRNFIYIGETNSSWSYPQVSVTEFTAGYVGITNAWSDGWAIDFVTSFSNVTRTEVARTDVKASGNQTISGTKTFSSAVVLSTAGTATNHAVRADRTLTINSGSGLSGGASQNLTGNRTWNLAVDGTVVRTSGNQSIDGRKTFNYGIGVTRNDGQIISPITFTQAMNLRFARAADTSNPPGSGSWGHLLTIQGWTTHNSSYPSYQLVFRNGAVSVRQSTSTSAWGGWRQLLETVNLGTSTATTTVTITNTAGSNASISGATTGAAGLVTTGNQTWGGTKTSSRFDGTSQMRSPIYYDRGNTSYLVRPANTGTAGTRLRGVRMDRLGIGAAASGSTGDLYVTRSIGVGTTPSGTTGQLRATNNIIAYSSDQRLKTNIVRIRTPLEKVQHLDGVEFDWDETTCNKWGFYPEGREVGLLAQQVQAVIPSAVKHAPFDMDIDNKSRSGENYLTVQYEKLVPLLIEAIKEQQKRIESLEELVCKK